MEIKCLGNNFKKELECWLQEKPECQRRVTCIFAFAAPPDTKIDPKKRNAAKNVGSVGNPKMKPTGCENLEIKTKRVETRRYII